MEGLLTWTGPGTVTEAAENLRNNGKHQVIIHRLIINADGTSKDVLHTGHQLISLSDDGAVQRVYFGDNLRPVIFDGVQNKIYFDADWVAPEQMPETTEAHQMLVTNADGEKVWEERTHYTATPYTKFIDNVTLTTNYASYRRTNIAPIPNWRDVVDITDVNATYDIIFNGQEYHCRVYNSVGKAGILCIGNCSAFTQNDNDIGDGEPFGIIVTYGELHTDTAGDYTLSISSNIRIYKTIPGDYTHVYLGTDGGAVIGNKYKGNVDSDLGKNSIIINAVAGGTATGDFAFNTGSGRATGQTSVAFQTGSASGTMSFAAGYFTEARGEYQVVLGASNVVDSESKYALIIGNGDYM